jgi:Ca2+-binding RTX toxin-like protein
MTKLDQRSFNFNQADLNFILTQIEFRALFSMDAAGNLVPIISGWDGTTAIYDATGTQLYDPTKSYSAADVRAMAQKAFASYGQVYNASGKAIIGWDGSGAIYDAHGALIWNGIAALNANGTLPALEALAIFGPSYGTFNTGSAVTDIAGLRIVSGLFNNLNPDRTHWGEVDGIFPRVAGQPNYDFVQQVTGPQTTVNSETTSTVVSDGPTTTKTTDPDINGRRFTYGWFDRTTTVTDVKTITSDGHHLVVSSNQVSTDVTTTTVELDAYSKQPTGMPSTSQNTHSETSFLSGGELDPTYHPQFTATASNPNDPTFDPAHYVPNLKDRANIADNTDYSVTFDPVTKAKTEYSVIDYTPRMITQTTTQGGTPVQYLKVADPTAITRDALDPTSTGGFAYDYAGGTGVVLLRDGLNHIVYWNSKEYDAGLVAYVEDQITHGNLTLAQLRDPATTGTTLGTDGTGRAIVWNPDAYNYSKPIYDNHIDTRALIEGAPIVNTSVALLPGQADGSGGVTDQGDANLYSGAGYGELSMTGQHDKQNTDANSATGFGNHEYFYGNVASIAGNAPNNGWFALFGQFFDHGLDFIGKETTYQIVVPLAVDDPLYGVIGPDGQPTTSITINRAIVAGPVQETDPVTGQPMVDAKGNPVYVAGYQNHDSPYIDQSQTYGSQTQTDNILRNWVKDPNTGAWIMGDTLVDGHTVKAYTDAFGNTTTATLPTLNELREEIRSHGGGVGGLRADLTWEDVSQGLRLRDANGAVITGPGAGVVEPLLLDNNPHYDNGHLSQAALNAVNAAIDAAKLPSDLHLSFNAHGDLQGAPDQQGNPTYGLAALAPFINFADFSIQSNLYGAGPQMPVIGDALHAAIGEVMMEAVGDHFIAGDGRANENMGLTTIHHVFHMEHSYQVQNIETYILGIDKENLTGSDAAHPHATAHDWQVAVAVKAGVAVDPSVTLVDGHYEAKAGSVVARDTDGNFYVTSADQAVAAADTNHAFAGYVTDTQGNILTADGSYTDALGTITWDQDKMFNAAKMTVEMEYQHIAVDQYSRAVSPNIQEFGGYTSDRNADISLEYGQAAFRFGHSTLRETIDTMDPTGGITGKIMSYALEQAFLNPALFSQIGPGSIALGMERQLMNEVDNYITPSMNEGLLGQPMDLGAINIARGRDVGMPTLNEAKTALGMKAYADWADFGAQMVHPESLVDFIAAYSFDGDMVKAQTIVDLAAGTAFSALSADEQAYAKTLASSYADQVAYATNFMNGGDKGIDKVDLWIGGLAEMHVAGGVLGETFDTIFVTQIENLMDGDRFYYLQRLVNQQFGNEIQNEQFKDLVERTTGVTDMNGNVFAYADQYYDEGRAAKVATADLTDPTKLGNLYAGSKSDGSWHQVFQVDSTGKAGAWLNDATGAFTSQTPVAGPIYDLWGQEVVDLFAADGHKVFDRATMTWTDPAYDPTVSAAQADKAVYFDHNTDMTTGISPGSADPNFALVSLGADQHKYQQIVDAHATDTNHFGADGISDTGAVIVDDSHDTGVGIWSVGGPTTLANGQIQEHAFLLNLNDGTDAYGNLPALLKPAGAIGGIDPSVNPTDHVTIDQKYILDVRPDGSTVNLDGSVDSGASAAEVLVGTKFDDYIEMGIGDDTAYGGDGNDVIFGGKSNAGHNTLYGGDGADFLFGGDAPDLIDGGKGDDWIWGNSSGASVGGMDQLIGNDGNDHIFGGIGIDKLFGGNGDDFMYGGQDTDPTFFGGDGNDYMQGGTGSDFMNGDGGDDIMDGGPDVDQLFGGAGDDILRPGPGVTSVGGNGGGADVLIGGDSATGPDGQTTDNGFDFADYSQQVGAIGIVGDLADQAAVSQLPKDKTPLPAGTPAATSTGDVWFEMEGIIGTKNGDVLRGDSPADVSAVVSHGDNWLIGGSGDDVLQGRGGNDVIVGGSIRLDTLIGTYMDVVRNPDGTPVLNPDGTVKMVNDPYASYVDGASHRVAADAVLTGGLLAAASGDGVTFDPHLTDLLKSGAYKDYFLGDGAPSGGNDTALYTGKLADYTLVAIDAAGHVVADPHHNWGTVAAIKITDNRAAADFVDANGNPLLDASGQPMVNEGTDLVIGVQNFAFADQTINIQAYYDKAPTLDLHYAPALATIATDTFSSNNNPYSGGSGWNGSWNETGDVTGRNPATTGAIQRGNGYLQFVQATGAGADGAAISREANLSGLSGAKLTFDLTKNGIGSAEKLLLQYSSDGGVSFTTLVTYGDGTLGTSGATGTQTVDLSALTLDSQFQIRFVVNHLNGASDYFRVDNVTISALKDSDPGVNYTTSYQERAAGVAIAATPLITDPDDTTIASARIVLRDGITGDQLNLGALTGGITASKVSATEIDLTGVASQAAYQAALAAITFSDPTNHNPTNANRHIDVTVNDGLKDSAIATTTVHFAPVNDAPTPGADNIITNRVIGSSFAVADWTLLANDTDPDSATLSITGVVSPQTGMNASHASGVTTVTDTGNPGGSFNYTVNDGSGTSTATAIGHVTLTTTTATAITGTDGNDDIVLAVDNAANTIDGGLGTNTADYSAYSAALSVDFTKASVVVGGSGLTTATSDTLVNIQNLVEGAGNDTLVVASDNVRHVYDGGAGSSDTIDFSHFSTALAIDLRSTSADTSGFATVTGSGTDAAHSDLVKNFENVVGGSGNDVLTVGTATIAFTGGLGSDTLTFAALAQIKNGTSRDVFTDFASGADKIDLHLVDANSNQSGTPHFTFNDATAFWNGQGNEFTGAAQVRYHDQTINGQVHTILDLHTTNGAGQADHQIDLGVGTKAIHATDLILS